MNGIFALSAVLDVDALARPAWLLWLLPAAAVSIAFAMRAKPSAIAWPALAEARAAGARSFDGARTLALVLRGGALLALAGVLAGPVGVHRAPSEPGHGLDLVLALDASGSMRAVDTEVGGRSRTRLELARQVVARFAQRRAAEGDRVALVIFGESAFTSCPLTGDGNLLAASLDRVEAGIAGEATAIGDALALAVKRALAGASGSTSGAPLAGRVVVLLTDGRSNAGTVPVELATEIARAEGVRVHTVAIGTSGGEVPMEGDVADGMRLERHDVDHESLGRIAAATGGRFFPARRADQLDAVYREIDALERVTRSLPPRIRQTDRPEPMLALAAGLLLAEITSARVLRRRLP